MPQPDIVFIVLDTQRADRLGSYGYKARETGKSITSNLDRFAESGALFERAVSPAQWTVPSHASMFTGLYPTAHQVTQSNMSLSPDRIHLAEGLKTSGYETIGFCNNPLVGILNNGFKRGFDTYYNYGGAIPSMPRSSTRLPWPLNDLLARYTQFLRRISYPIQNFFGRSDLAFRISINAWLTPLWSKMANFKGQNERSIRDICEFLAAREKKQTNKPLFLFLNLMETHLPFWPPGEFVDLVAPYMRRDNQAREIMRRWNREAYRWAAPLEQPFEELEYRVLSDMYDAEVAYQDNYLGWLFRSLEERKNASNTLTLIVSDHGDGLGEHNFFGHAFVAYDELIHVPLMIHWPEQINGGTKVSEAVSTRRIFHTLLDAAGVADGLLERDEQSELALLSLMHNVFGRDPEDDTAHAEVYPPLNFAKAVQHRQPELLARYRCLEMRRAIVQDGLKLIQVGDAADELFDLESDPLELVDILGSHPVEAAALNRQLEAFAARNEILGDGIKAGATLSLEADEKLAQRLRALGYLE